jgi:hypothetical protein
LWAVLWAYHDFNMRKLKREARARKAEEAEEEALAKIKVGRCRLTPGWTQVGPRFTPG